MLPSLVYDMQRNHNETSGAKGRGKRNGNVTAQSSVVPRYAFVSFVTNFATVRRLSSPEHFEGVISSGKLARSD